MNFYPPNNKDFKLPAGELPPLLVKIHGGPTSQVNSHPDPIIMIRGGGGGAGGGLLFLVPFVSKDLMLEMVEYISHLLELIVQA